MEEVGDLCDRLVPVIPVTHYTDRACQVGLSDSAVSDSHGLCEQLAVLFQFYGEGRVTIYRQCPVDIAERAENDFARLFYFDSKTAVYIGNGTVCRSLYKDTCPDDGLAALVRNRSLDFEIRGGLVLLRTCCLSSGARYGVQRHHAGNQRCTKQDFPAVRICFG